ncbi:MAG TPA: penicillin acylase family protein [Solirubrobacterales bacterium]|jgi:penicillin amidase|nr:penicillin acylase family protein [Solirubrobacterales bacterium]
MNLLTDCRTVRAGFLAAAVGTGLTTAASAAAWHWLARRPLPQQRGMIELEGLGGRVRVRRDRWGVPHIDVDDYDDLHFAQGFCHGQDRLWQMDFYRRVVEGRVAEMAGDDGLAIDRLLRTLGIRRAAEREAAALEPPLHARLERFCEGVNASVGAATALPFEMQLLKLDFAPWRPADILSLGKLLAFGLSTNWERELLRADMVRTLGPELTAKLDPGYPADNPVVTEEAWSGDGLAIVEQIDAVRRSLGLAVEASGSNNWAISGARSATGGPLIAGDPHLPPSMPGIWYQVSLRHRDRFVRGASMPGMPGVYMGQNNDVCWTFTNVMADVQDLFIERIEGDSYLFEGEWQPLQVVREEITVKGHEEPVAIDVRHTHHGPIVNEALGADEAEPLALRWATLDEPTSFAGMFELLEIGSGAELVAKLEGHTSPASNLVWADRDSIGYKLIGRLPRRRGGCPDLPKPGWTGEYEWEGTVPYEELPEVVDPASGFLVTANNRIVGDEYPHHITSEWLDGFRAKRIEQLLTGSDEHDLEGFAAMQTDVLSLPGLEAARRLGRLSPRGQREVSALERLRSWDGRLDPETIAGTIYQAFLLRLGREVARAAIGDRDLCERWLDRADNGFTAHTTSPWRWHSHLMKLWEEGDEELIGRPWDGLVLEALSGALDDLAERFGPDPDGWRWGRVHEMEFPHPLGDANPLLRRLLNRRLRAGGAQETVSQIAYDPNDPYKAVWAPSWRMVADPADPDRSRWQMFTGQSGHPASPHYDDLQADWLEGRTQPMCGEGPWQELELIPA